ncbi:hypothetical protein SS1G_02211 [Sclerotinia sclerotiorum 1980 UF-70]|uniref:Carrier domain-containing protein n=1 Tax=Sclerotinia sclerotiorum (strain ATCC 18683 / 1980 / Ss-1) TaxID=665079 RepID=A7EA79_SCLS1|nr:hypothetical protein SS1G_02211 [Sclerotinia sclerotiorum 1980 UF-70]EDN99357.1 hypothetical protein SS1G_02211 [Sclerotinia sclerotiorum 1980 UF-70]
MVQNSQEPIAIIGFACRLPGGNTTPKKLWEFLRRGDVASNKVPKSRFNVEGHWDGSQKPHTMRTCGGMFLEDIDLADFDASFFEISRIDAISMDPNQRQMLEVVFEGLENSGIPLESLDGAPVGCFIGSYASDYSDMQNRDPEDKPANFKIGVGRVTMANRLSHFLNIKGPSMTIDTACSSSLGSLDVACRYLQSREINAAIIAASNLYLNPEHVMNLGEVSNAYSPTGLCHTFDLDADGYVKAEAVSSIIVKRLSDALRDSDPIRAVIRGSATNSSGRTSGIATPSAEAQYAVIRAAYANAGITDLDETAYLECHGTGTQTSDTIEAEVAALAFSGTRSRDRPLIIGSIKSNLGHAGPAAGISGIIKAVMAIENGIIPGNPTFINPNPKIDFARLKVKATRTAIPWPASSIRRASVNSFGHGGSNAHVIFEQPEFSDGPKHATSYLSDSDDFDLDEDDSEHPYTLVLSANDKASLKANIMALCNHLINPSVKVDLKDLAYTLSERRTRFWHRAYITTQNTDIDENDFIIGQKNPEALRIGFVFTGQGAQWPQMGKKLLQFFPWTREILEHLDDALQSLSEPPNWLLIHELTEVRSTEHFRRPEFSQTLVTALQLCVIEVLRKWGVKPQSVVGHSSGEIAAAYAAGFLDQATAIKVAYYIGRAALNRKNEVESGAGMLAVGLGAEGILPYLEKYAGQVWIACYNSPSSLTVSGKRGAFESLAEELKAGNHFCRLLEVDLAYHSELIGVIAEEYEKILKSDFTCLRGSSDVSMFSSVTGSKKNTTTDALYWKTNLVSPVCFDKALIELLSQEKGPNFLIEIGPSGALARPISQILKSLPNGDSISYNPSWARGQHAGKAIFDLAGFLFVTGHDINLGNVNQYTEAKTLIDLPNYNWNHSIKYWHENESSKDWRFKKFVNHDLLGSKVLGTTWQSPTWRKLLNLSDVPWLKDHKIGSDVLMPAAGYITMAVEALYQKTRVLATDDKTINSPNELCYRFRNIRFAKPLVLEDDKVSTVLLSLTQKHGVTDWQEFRISSTTGDLMVEHCSGLIRLQDPVDESLAESDDKPLQYPTVGKAWYKSQAEAGYGFGPSFQKLLNVESKSGQRQCRVKVSLEEPSSKWSPQFCYPIHPASLDGCFQTVTPALWAGEHSSVNAVLVPAIIDDLIINSVPSGVKEGLSLATSEYSGHGRLEEAKSYFANCSVYQPENGVLLMQMTGLRFAKLDMGIKTDPHVFHCISWKPDVTFLSHEKLVGLNQENFEPQLDTVIDLIAHKKPGLIILEVKLNSTEIRSTWFEPGHLSSRSAYLQYDFASDNARDLASLGIKYKTKSNTSFFLLNTTKEALGFSSDAMYDLVILKISKTSVVDQIVNDILRYIKAHLFHKGYVLVVDEEDRLQSRISSVHTPSLDESVKSPSPSSAGSTKPLEIATKPFESIAENSEISGTIEKVVSEEVHKSKRKSLESDAAVAGLTQGFSNHETMREAMKVHKFTSILQVPSDEDSLAWSLYTNEAQVGVNSHLRKLIIVQLSENTPSLDPSLKAALELSGWKIKNVTYPPKILTETGAVILVLDELYGPVLTNIDATQWGGLKMLISSGNHLLWVTKGAQYKVTHPNNALVQGLFRVARRENPSAKLNILDVESSTGPATEYAIDAVLKSLESSPPNSGFDVDTEFVERNGILYVQRVVPDFPVNEFKRAEVEGAEPILRNLHEVEAAVQLRAESLGTFQGLTWCETAVGEVPVDPEKIEIDVMAVGVNFKDVAVTMDIVPGNEYSIGYEGAGIVKRLGPGVTKFKVGDRVCFLNNGSYANRLQVAIGRAHAIPDSMSFEDAATIPMMYLCSFYSLCDIANLREGQSVLIHSASGGVGIACLQLARHMKAEIYVTVGTEEKGKFLTDSYGIPPSRDPFIARLLGQIFELINGGHIKPINPVTVFGFNDIPAALTLMHSGRHIGKVVVSDKGKSLQVPIRPATQKLKLRPDASYLIVGGLKGMCGSLAIHMARHGAMNIIACSRSGINDAASQKIVMNCLAYGCKVVDAQGDAANVNFMRKVFRQASPRITGVIHGAMILRDRPLETMTLDDYHTALHAKINGTWNLHYICQEQKEPLDFFTLLSSISGVVGNKGQANYAAGNTFLDAFAEYRESLGLRANSVDLA